eukprot:1093788-Pelagomonas_calceolata.AAC.3
MHAAAAAAIRGEAEKEWDTRAPSSVGGNGAPVRLCCAPPQTATPGDRERGIAAAPAGQEEGAREKNVESDLLEGKVGRIYVPSQDVDRMALAKPKGTKRQRHEVRSQGWRELKHAIVRNPVRKAPRGMYYGVRGQGEIFSSFDVFWGGAPWELLLGPWLSLLAKPRLLSADKAFRSCKTRVSTERRRRVLCRVGHCRNRHSHGDVLLCGMVDAGWKEN